MELIMRPVPRKKLRCFSGMAPPNLTRKPVRAAVVTAIASAVIEPAMVRYFNLCLLTPLTIAYTILPVKAGKEGRMRVRPVKNNIGQIPGI